MSKLNWPREEVQPRWLRRINWSIVFIIATIVMVAGLVMLMTGLTALYSESGNTSLLAGGSVLTFVGFAILMTACCYYDEFKVSIISRSFRAQI